MSQLMGHGKPPVPTRSWSVLSLAAMACLWLLGGLLPAPAATDADVRVALVVGNAAYENAPHLANPRNDAGDVAASLRRLGFEVVEAQDATKRAMDGALARFARLAAGADTALFFYAGHGIQFKGQNYIVPVDARFEDEFSIPYETTRVDDVLDALSRARNARLLILDACRNNPLAAKLAGRTRDLSPDRGLARTERAQGTVVAYATQANEVAVDGGGRNSPFTSAFIEQLEQPGLEVAQLFRRVAARVSRATGGRQVPELSISLLGDLYLNRSPTDLQAWDSLRRSEDPAALTNFLQQFPTSDLADAARARLDALAGRARAAEGARVAVAALLPSPAAMISSPPPEPVVSSAPGAAALPAPVEAPSAARQSVVAPLVAAAPAPPTVVPKPISEGVARVAALSAPVVAAPTASIAAAPVAAVPTAAGPELVGSIQRELTRLGCFRGRADGSWSGAATGRAVREYARFASVEAPAGPSDALLSTLRERGSRLCPLVCARGQVERGGACVAKACLAGQRLVGGDCVAPAPRRTVVREAPRRAPRAEPAPSAPAAAPSGGRRCFGYYGQSYCE